MPRLARITIPGVPHHVTQRGNDRQDVFFVDDDRRMYLDLLERQAEHYGLDVLGYCLMPNHVHLVAVPRREDSLAKAVGRTHFLYTQYLHRLHGRSGHLWQNRFYSCALDDPHCWAALCYIERNPVRAKIVRVPWRYRWSSAAAHCGLGKANGFLDMRRWRAAWTPERWKERVRRPEDEKAVLAVRANTRTGRPLGSERFLSQLERRLGRRLRPLPVGRPRKVPEKREDR
jgi:putative transposase